MTGTLLQQAMSPAKPQINAPVPTPEEEKKHQEKKPQKGRMPRYELIPGEKERGLLVEWPESLINEVKVAAYNQHKSVKVWLGEIVIKKLRLQVKNDKQH